MQTSNQTSNQASQESQDLIGRINKLEVAFDTYVFPEEIDYYANYAKMTLKKRFIEMRRSLNRKGMGKKEKLEMIGQEVYNIERWLERAKA